VRTIFTFLLGRELVKTTSREEMTASSVYMLPHIHPLAVGLLSGPMRSWKTTTTAFEPGGSRGDSGGSGDTPVSVISGPSLV